MSRARGTRVYILGAGCSKPSGYPLGDGFPVWLRNYAANLPDGSLKIKPSVEKTLDLLGRFKVDTLDHLVTLIEDNLSIPDRSTLPADPAKWPFDDRLRNAGALSDLADEQINSAKTGTAAMFRHLEADAAESKLPGYPRLMAEIFGKGDWKEALKRADCHVPTFNYDRLFEMAFLEHFKESGPPLLVHDGNVLNSGLNGPTCDEANITPGRFCFLKLHGSAGWWVRRGKGTRGVTECRCYHVDPVDG
jgi:hypothetical protein